MASVKEQYLPPEIEDEYLEIMGEATLKPHPGASKGKLDLSVAKRYPRLGQAGPPPTWAQLQQRGAFKGATACFDAAPSNERNAYFTLAPWDGMPYYNFYMHRNIPLIEDGETCADFGRPHARAKKMTSGVTIHGATYSMHHEDPVLIQYDIESDVTEYHWINYLVYPHHCAFYQWYLNEDDDHWYLDPASLQLLDFTNRTRHTDEFTIPSPGYPWRRIEFAHAQAWSKRAVIWHLTHDFIFDDWDYTGWAEDE